MQVKPDLVLVHGDTTSTISSTLACYYNKTKVGHIEAGLRTGDIYSPWPEEINRKLVAQISDLHFAPTIFARKNLENEGIKKSKIILTGNTIVDSVLIIKNEIFNSRSIKIKLDKKFSFLDYKKKIILVTGHRRENFGTNFTNIFKALKHIAAKHKELNIIYPVHLNPNVLKPANYILGKIKNIFLLKPLDYISFVYLMNRSSLIISDSGGIQEEAPSLGVPVLVTRKVTERPEAIKFGTSILVGSKIKNIIKTTEKIINNNKFKKNIVLKNPYGDGNASKKIVRFLISNL